MPVARTLALGDRAGRLLGVSVGRRDDGFPCPHLILARARPSLNGGTHHIAPAAADGRGRMVPVAGASTTRIVVLACLEVRTLVNCLAEFPAPRILLFLIKTNFFSLLILFLFVFHKLILH